MRTRLLILPGIDGLAEWFDPHREALAERWLVEAASYGDPADPSDHAAYVAAARRALDRGPAVLLGMSFGGSVALRVAAAEPERVLGVVLLNAFARLPPLSRLCSRAGPLLARLPQRPFAALRGGGAAWRLLGRDTPASARAALRATIARAETASLFRRLGLLARFDARADLERIRQPVLLIASGRDRVVPAVSEAREMAAALAQSRLELLPEAGHLPLLDSGFSLARVLEGFPP